MGSRLNVPADGLCDLEMPDDGEMAAVVNHQLRHLH
jgi:hypothetical protein